MCRLFYVGSDVVTKVPRSWLYSFPCSDIYGRGGNSSAIKCASKRLEAAADGEVTQQKRTVTLRRAGLLAG